MNRGPIAEVAVNAPILKCFHYRVPVELEGTLETGHRVLVPFGKRRATGVCVGFAAESPVERLKPIEKVLHPDCRFDAHLLELTRWIASYYRASWGEVLEAALPPAIRSGREERLRREVARARAPEEMRAEAERLGRRAAARARVLLHLADLPGADAREDRSVLLARCRAGSATLSALAAAGWIVETSAVARSDPYAEELAAWTPRPLPALNPDQELAAAAIAEAIDGGAFRAILLFGVTGSGKTEVYLHALRKVLEDGRRGLVLLPEISLTPQTVLRFREALPDAPLAVLHSMLSSAERTGQWRDIQEGKARLVIGARSAIFAPIPELGLIVVDEEHESSYKQESSPRYHARDIAVMRAHILGIPIVLGSATPSLESMHNARSGKYTLVELPRRATAHDLPLISLIPLDQDFYHPDGKGLISPQLDTLIRKQLRDGEQTLIYLNRRGFSTYVHCLQCGHVLKCSQCDVSLTFHRRERLMRCHYCGSVRELPDRCPECNSPRVRRSGVGTERVVAELEKRYPGARVLRLDRDAVTTHRTLRAALSAFARGEYDILAGTQMVAKGHDFPRVSLVGILLADTGLHFPDFRAAERTFQLITQVSGRAGRGRRPGRVLVQTFSAEHYAVQHAAAGDYAGLAERELEYRKELGYPPFGRLAKVLLSGAGEERVRKEAERLGACLREALPAQEDSGEPSGLRQRRSGGVEVLGPAPAPIARLQGKYRSQILIKSRSPARIHELLEKAGRDLAGRRGVDVSIDIDPQTML